MADDLVTLSSKRVTGYQCCGGDHVLSCNLANVQLENLGTEKVNLPGNLTLDFLNNVNGNLNTYHYGSNDGEAVVTYNPKNNELHVHAFSTDGKSYVLDFCGSSGYVWKCLEMSELEEVFTEFEVEMSSVAPPVPPTTTAPVMCEVGWAASSIEILKKFKRFRHQGPRPRYRCQLECKKKSKEGCIAFEYNIKKKTCTLKKLGFKKRNKVCTGFPERTRNSSPIISSKSVKSLYKWFTWKNDGLTATDCQAACQVGSMYGIRGCIAYNFKFKGKTICEFMRLEIEETKGTYIGITNQHSLQIQ